eukprot:842239_1
MLKMGLYATMDQICKDKKPKDCQCIDAQQPTTPFDLHAAERKGNGAVIWETLHVEGGKKYVTTIDGNIGLHAMDMFTDVIHHGVPDNKVNLKLTAPQPAGATNKKK